MKTPLLLRLPLAMKEWLKQDADSRGLTLTGLILAILSEYRAQRSNAGRG